MENNVDPTSDDRLMSRLALGETDALGELYVRYERMVKATLCHFSPEMSAADVEEITQEVFIAVHDMAPRYKPQSKFRAWLWGISSRKASDWRRKTWVRRRLLRESAGESSPAMAWRKEQSPIKKVEQRETIGLMLAALPRKQREVLMLHVVEGLKGDEIAQLLNIRPKTVRTRLHRARQQLLDSDLAKLWQQTGDNS